jgi:hypothetical protein
MQLTLATDVPNSPYNFEITSSFFFPFLFYDLETYIHHLATPKYDVGSDFTRRNASDISVIYLFLFFVIMDRNFLRSIFNKRKKEENILKQRLS